jgi:uncharacterized cupin superfamily protein
MGVNINSPDFDDRRDRTGFAVSRARIGDQLATARLGVSLWELPPGQALSPYHYHLAEEELVVVLSGSPSLRSPNGWSELVDGDVVSFPRGERGAHQIVNRTGATVRLLAIGTKGEPDIVLYPDSGKLGAIAKPSDDDGGVRGFFHIDDGVDLWDGELPPAAPG